MSTPTLHRRVLPSALRRLPTPGRTSPARRQLLHLADYAEATEIERCMRLIERLHRIDRSVARCVVVPEPLRANGRFTRHEGASVIALNPKAQRIGLTHVHETGHWLDTAVIGRDGKSAAASAEDRRLDAWRKRVALSDRYNELLAGRVGPDAETKLSETHTVKTWTSYLLLAQELWARSYAQWVASRSGDPTLNLAVEARRTGVYPSHWTDEDFEPIAREIDKLFRSLSWA